jgi:hypothetical protein
MLVWGRSLSVCVGFPSQQLDSPFRESCLDALLERELKEGFAKRWGRSQLPPTYNLKKANALRPDVAVVPLDPASPRGRLIAFADEIGTMMQVGLFRFCGCVLEIHAVCGVTPVQLTRILEKHKAISSVWLGCVGSGPAVLESVAWRLRRRHSVGSRVVAAVILEK